MKTKDITVTSLFAVLLFISSYLRIPIGAVPITTQTFFVILIGLLLTPKFAFLATTTSLILQCIFQSVYAKPTFGYVIGFGVASTFIALLKASQRHIVTLTIIVLIASLLIFAVGVPYFTMMLKGKYTLLSSLQVAFYPFIIGDAVKAIIAILVAQPLKPLLK